MRERGHAIPVEPWWLNLARRVIASDLRDYDTLGADLAKHVKRKEPFKKSVLSLFVSGKKPATVELATAICIEFRIPRPIFVARSYEEAVHLESVTERHAHAPANDVEAPIVAMPPITERRRRKRASGAPATQLQHSAAPKRRAR